MVGRRIDFDPTAAASRCLGLARSTTQILLGCISLVLLFTPGTLPRASGPSEAYGFAKNRWHVQDAEGEEGTQDWRYASYLDLGQTFNFNDPGNNRWRSKTTTFKVSDPRVNMAMGYVRKATSPQSPWGMELGLQTGVDTEGLVPKDPVSSADTLRHLYRTNVAYLFQTGNGLELTAGLIDSYIGYESFFAVQNPNYTRGYLLDHVPYFLLGLQGAYPINDTMDLSLFLVEGWDYLAHVNDALSYGLQASWQLSPRARFTQNLYYGPDQTNTDVEFWRFFSDSIIEWNDGRFLLAAAFDVGAEKQADVAGNPRHEWAAAAIWLGWHIGGPWNLALRPELYWDPDGVGTGAKQRIGAITATAQYTFSPLVSNTIVASLEYRYDRSTGPEGGFFKGDDNRLVPDQHQILFSLMWTFGP